MAGASYIIFNGFYVTNYYGLKDSYWFELYVERKSRASLAHFVDLELPKCLFFLLVGLKFLFKSAFLFFEFVFFNLIILNLDLFDDFFDFLFLALHLT